MRDFLDTAKLRVAELRGGQFVPSAAISVGVLGGLPLSQLILGALGELGVPIGPHTGALLGVLISAGAAYLTRAGRRYKQDTNKKARRRGPRP